MLNSCLFGGRCFLRFGQWQTYAEAASFARFALHCDASIQQFHRVADDGKPKPETVFRHGVAQSLERSEYPCQLFFGHPCSRVFHY